MSLVFLLGLWLHPRDAMAQPPEKEPPREEPPREEPPQEESSPPIRRGQPPPLEAEVGGETIDVPQGEEVLRARAALFEVLVQEGYTRRQRKVDRTVFLSEDPWKPRVIVHDDGWMYFRREPPRLHAPGRSFADQGSAAAYLLCIVAPPTCVSVGGLVVSPRKLGAVKARVVDASREKVQGMNDAVARRELGRRLNDQIPRDLDRIWTTAALTADQRRVLLFEYWDARTDTPEGDAARGAIEAFLRGVVQQSNAPFTAEELDKLNAARYGRPVLALPFASGAGG